MLACLLAALFQRKCSPGRNPGQIWTPRELEKFHGYLAVVNAKKCVIHVLDSMGLQIQDRKDLKITVRIITFVWFFIITLLLLYAAYLSQQLQGLERQIKYVLEHKQMNRDKW